MIIMFTVVKLESREGGGGGGSHWKEEEEEREEGGLCIRLPHQQKILTLQGISRHPPYRDNGMATY